MSSTLRLFRVRGNQAIEDGTVEQTIVALYRSQTKCASSAADPNVWGVGWSPDGARLLLLVQATVNSPCGKPGSFVGMTMSLAKGRVLEQLSEHATKRKFQALLPRELCAK